MDSGLSHHDQQQMCEEHQQFSEGVMNIYQRLNAVMQEVSYVQKEDKKVNNQYTFVSHDAVTAKVRPSLIKHGIVMTTDVKEVKQDGNRTEAIVVLRFVNIDKPEDSVAITCFGYGIDPSDKGPGKAVSYAVKYGILKTLCLETGDDPERDQIDHQQEDKARAEQEKLLVGLARKASKKGVEEYKKFWTGLAAEEKQLIGPHRHVDFKLAAEEIATQP